MEPDDVLDGCRRRAAKLYMAEHVLSHERHATNLGRFLEARVSASPERDALISVIRFEVEIARYLSCGEKAIVHSLAVLLRLALTWADHPDYDPDWRS
jgi:hypothetical protein